MLFEANAEKFYQKRGYKLMIMQRDRGELTSNGFIHELVLESINSNLTALYIHQQDGIAEMLNIIIVNDANTMIK